MEKEKVHLGEGIVDEAKNVLNKETKEIINVIIKAFSKNIEEVSTIQSACHYLEQIASIWYGKKLCIYYG